MARWKDVWDMLVRKLKINHGQGFKTRHVPVTAVLVLTAFAPSVSAPNPKTATPPTAAVTITRYAPILTAPSPVTVVPATRSLALNEFPAAADATNHRLVIPAPKALALTRLVPVVINTGHQAVIPTTVVLTVSRFAGTVSTSAHQRVTPPTKALALTRYAPTVASTGVQLVVPTTKALTVTKFAPSIVQSSNQRVSPTAKAFVVTMFAPVVAGSQTVTPTTRALTATRRVPTVTASNHQRVTPARKTLATTRYAPTVVSANHILLIPAKRTLTTNRHAPTVTATLKQLVVPAKKTLTVTRYAPTVTAGTSLANFYIAPTGNDTTGNGTIGNPWATVAKFLAKPPVAGDTLYCRGGTYSGLVGNRNNYIFGTPPAGTAGNPITIAAYPGETPIFDGGAGTTLNNRFFIALYDGANYWTIDGLRLQGFCQAFFGVIQISRNTTAVDHVEIKNCRIDLTSPLAGNTEHAIYIAERATNTLVEGCTLNGPVSVKADTGAGIHLFHSPPMTGFVLRRNSLAGWQDAILLWESGATGTIEWNTFHNNTRYHIDANNHSTLLVRNNVGETGATLLNDGNPGATTNSHNYGNQTLTSTGALTAGSPAINGATDGSDAGAIDYP